MDAVSSSSGLMVSRPQATQEAIREALTPDLINPDDLVLNGPYSLLESAQQTNAALRDAAIGVGQRLDTRA